MSWAQSRDLSGNWEQHSWWREYISKSREAGDSRCACEPLAGHATRALSCWCLQCPQLPWFSCFLLYFWFLALLEPTSTRAVLCPSAVSDSLFTTSAASYLPRTLCATLVPLLAGHIARSFRQDLGKHCSPAKCPQKALPHCVHTAKTLWLSLLLMTTFLSVELLPLVF